MNVLVSFAVHAEFRPWLRLRSFRREVAERCTYYESEIANLVVRVFLTGIGQHHAHEVIKIALGVKADAVLASGLAGSLKPSYRVGDIPAARFVRFGLTDQCLASDEGLLSLALDCGAKAVDSFISTNVIAATVEQKAVLGASGDAVDMESFAILAEAQDAGIPAIALRCVADQCDKDLPCDFDKMVEERGQLRMWRLALEPLRAPLRLPEFIRFAVASHRAASRLARFLEQYLQALAGRGIDPSIASLKKVYNPASAAPFRRAGL